MDTKFQSLPPLKRFRLLQQQQQQQQQEQKENDATAAPSLCLPAKKRKESRDPPFLSEPSIITTTTTTTYCLPAKKRVWAFQPEFIDNKPLSPIDLNIEYKPSFDEDKEIPFVGEQEIQDDDDGVDIDDGILCAVCQSTDGDPIDPIVFCDGCNLMVHTTCYGDPLIKGVPDGDWFCKQCSFSNNKNIGFSCCLCPIKGGAMKPTNDGQWAHIVCALLVPEVFFGDPEGREDIDCSSVPKWRWERECYVCKSDNGCVIDCSEPKCGLAFHVTCGLSKDLCIEYREGRKKGAVVAGFCKDHTELWKKQQQTGKFKIVAREENKK